MKNSVETILHDIKKLFKELELAYGEVQPHLCDVNLEKCPNTKCWVQKIRDEQFERICEFERITLSCINDLTAIQKETSNEKLQEVIKRLEYSINPTPCQDCAKYNGCTKSYRASSYHDAPCVSFVNK